MRDLSFALRNFARTPTAILLAVIAIALGIGANTAVFGMVRALLLKPLPYGDPDRLMAVYESSRSVGTPRVDTALANYEEWRDHATSFESIAASAYWVPSLTGMGDAEQVLAGHVTANFFGTLGVRPAIGRDFTASEDQEGRNTVIILSHSFWTNRLASDPNVLGKNLLLDKAPYTIVGVMPASFEHPDQKRPSVLFWRPLGEHGGRHPGSGYLRVVARLKPGVSAEQARAEMQEITQRIAGGLHPHNAPLEGQTIPLASSLRGDAREPLRILLLAVALVHLIVCSNVAHLLLARGAERRREYAIRAALGSTRLRIVCQVFTESVLLGLAGGGLGVILAIWSRDALTVLARSYVPASVPIELDWTVVAYAAFLSLITTVLFGVFPAMAASRVTVINAIKEGPGGGHGPLLRLVIVGAEVALTMVLLSTAGLVIRSFWKLQSQELGFQPNHVITGEVRLKRGQEATSYNLNFMTELLTRVKRLPGIEVAGIVDALPLSGRNNESDFFIQGHPNPTPNAPNLSMLNFCSPEYFKVMQMRLLRGRLFDQRDGAGMPEVVVINDALARRYFPGEDPIGKQIKLTPQWQTIVGVIADPKHKSLTDAHIAQVYLSYAQHPLPRMALAVRTRGDSLNQISAIRHELTAMDADLPLGNIRTVEQLLDSAIAPRRLSMAVLACFALVAIVLAATGIYRVISYSVAQRTREIGVRMALGASTGNVLSLMLGQGMRIVTIGLVLGLCLALMATRWLGTMLFEVHPNDPVTFSVCIIMLTCVALAAIVAPARRAAGVDPLIAIRHD